MSLRRRFPLLCNALLGGNSSPRDGDRDSESSPQSSSPDCESFLSSSIESNADSTEGLTRVSNSNSARKQAGNRTNGHELETQWPFLNPPPPPIMLPLPPPPPPPPSLTPLFASHYSTGNLNQGVEEERNCNSTPNQNGAQTNGLQLLLQHLRPNIPQSTTSTYSSSSSSSSPSQFSNGSSNQGVVEEANSSSARRVNLPPAPSRSSRYTCDPPLYLSQPPSAQSANLHEGACRMPHSDSVSAVETSFPQAIQSIAFLSLLSAIETQFSAFGSAPPLAQYTPHHISPDQITPLDASIRPLQSPGGVECQYHSLPYAKPPLCSPTNKYAKYFN